MSDICRCRTHGFKSRCHCGNFAKTFERKHSVNTNEVVIPSQAEREAIRATYESDTSQEANVIRVLDAALTQLEAEIKDRADCEQSLTQQLLDVQAQRDTAYRLLRCIVDETDAIRNEDEELHDEILALLSLEEHRGDT